MKNQTRVSSFQDLNVWKKAHEFVMGVYKSTGKFPKSELYGLTSQIRRSAVSVPANIAEGKGRRTSKEYINFLTIARGSTEETRYFLILSKDLHYLDESIFNNLWNQASEIGRMLNGLINSINRTI